MDELELLAALIFSEADKNDKKFDTDAAGVAHSVLNRMKEPEKYGSTLDEVIFKPKQYSGVEGKEFKKFFNGGLTAEEEKYVKRAYKVAGGVLRGTISDPTGGANHYFNPKLVKPSWAKKMKKTFTSGSHDYYKG